MTCGRSQALKARFPTAAAINTLGPGRWPARIDLVPTAIVLEIIEAPFPDIASHILHAKGARATRKRAYRGTFRITIVYIAVAPCKDGVPIGEICQVAASFIVSPWISATIGPAGGVLPFGFCGQAIFLAFPRSEPSAKFDRIQAAHVYDRV